MAAYRQGTGRQARAEGPPHRPLRQRAHVKVIPLEAGPKEGAASGVKKYLHAHRLQAITPPRPLRLLQSFCHARQVGADAALHQHAMQQLFIQFGRGQAAHHFLENKLLGKLLAAGHKAHAQAG